VYLYLKPGVCHLFRSLRYLIKYNAYNAVTKCDMGPVLVSVCVNAYNKSQFQYIYKSLQRTWGRENTLHHCLEENQLTELKVRSLIMIRICAYLVFIKSCVTHTDNHV
jgi:hypothetical protein